MDEPFDKPSFLIYKHDYDTVRYLSNEELGLLFRAIGEYQLDKSAVIDVDPRIKQSFQFFKKRFDFDDKIKSCFTLDRFKISLRNLPVFTNPLFIPTF